MIYWKRNYWIMLSKTRNNLLSNAFHMYVFTFAKIVLPLFTLPYLTRILSLENYGLVAYVKSFNSYIQLLIDYGFILSATRSIVRAKDDYNEIGRITGNVFIEKLILSILGVFLTILLVDRIGILNENRLFVWLFFLSSLVTILIPDFLFRGLEKMEYITFPFIVSKLSVLILTFLVIDNDSDLLYIPILEILGNSLAAIISLYFVRKHKIRISYDNYKIWIMDLKYSSIYFFSNFATTVFGALTTLIVGIMLKKNEIAYWSICMQFVTAAKSLYSPIVNTIYPHMLVDFNLNLVKKISKLFVIPLILGSFIVLFAGEDIMVIIGGNQFYAAGKILKALLPVFIFSFYSMLIGWPVLGTQGMEKETTITTVVSAIIQIVGICLLIFLNRFDLLLLALCSGVSEMYLLISRLLLLSRLEKGMPK